MRLTLLFLFRWLRSLRTRRGARGYALGYDDGYAIGKVIGEGVANAEHHRRKVAEMQAMTSARHTWPTEEVRRGD